MLADGLMTRFPKPDRIFALHSSARYAAGTVNISAGPALANIDTLDVTLYGKGSHGSSPHMGVNVYTMLGEFLNRMATIVALEKDTAKLGSITVGAIHAGTIGSILPDEVNLKMSARSYDPDVRSLFLKRIPEVAKGIALTSNAPKEPKVVVVQSTDAVINDRPWTQKILDLADKHFGVGTGLPSNPIMGGEDFGNYGTVAKVPSVFFWVGVSEAKNSPSNHSSEYNPQFHKYGPFAIEAMTEVVLMSQKH